MGRAAHVAGAQQVCAGAAAPGIRRRTSLLEMRSIAEGTAYGAARVLQSGVSGVWTFVAMLLLNVLISIVAPVAFSAAGPALVPLRLYGQIGLSGLVAARVVAPSTRAARHVRGHPGRVEGEDAALVGGTADAAPPLPRPRASPPHAGPRPPAHLASPHAVRAACTAPPSPPPPPPPRGAPSPFGPAAGARQVVSFMPTAVQGLVWLLWAGALASALGVEVSNLWDKLGGPRRPLAPRRRGALEPSPAAPRAGAACCSGWRCSTTRPTWSAATARRPLRPGRPGDARHAARLDGHHPAGGAAADRAALRHGLRVRHPQRDARARAPLQLGADQVPPRRRRALRRRPPRRAPRRSRSRCSRRRAVPSRPRATATWLHQRGAGRRLRDVEVADDLGVRLQLCAGVPSASGRPARGGARQERDARRHAAGARRRGVALGRRGSVMHENAPAGQAVPDHGQHSASAVARLP